MAKNTQIKNQITVSFLKYDSVTSEAQNLCIRIQKIIIQSSNFKSTSNNNKQSLDHTQYVLNNEEVTDARFAGCK